MMSLKVTTAHASVIGLPVRHHRKFSGGSRPAYVVRCAQEEVTQVPANRRGILSAAIAAAAALSFRPSNALAAYGEPAKVFGSQPTNKSGFIPYEGEGYSFLIPSQWNPSAQRESKDTDFRYEDNYYPVNNVAVIKRKTDKSSIGELGPPEKFLAENVNLFGEQLYTGPSQEGGFAKDRVSSAHLLDLETVKDSKGKEYYKFHTITRTADGTEGGQHQLIAASVGDDRNLYILKVNVGDKRYYKGAKKQAEGVWNSFIVA